jgi:hypothetical protein
MARKQAIITKPDGIQYFGLLDMHDQNPTMSWEIISAKNLAAVCGNIRKQENLRGNPSYVVASADGVTEVIEHRHRGNVFYINDDPAVRAKLGLTGSARSSPNKR